MSYRKAILLRWSRRDQLATLLIAVSVAFVTGTVLITLAFGSQSAAIASEFGSDANAMFVDRDASRIDATDATLLSVAEVTVNEERRLLLGVPTNATIVTGRREIQLHDASQGRLTVGTINSPIEQTLTASGESITRIAFPRSESFVDPSWYVGNPDLVDRMGPDGTIVIGRAIDRDTGVPLRSALPFFSFGTKQAVRTLLTAALATALLVGVLVYSVTRMSVRDRIRTLRVIRSTGAPAHHVIGLYGVRAAVLTATGVTLGYAIGVVGVRLAVNLAVSIGLPTSLAVKITPTAVHILAPIYGGILAVGAGSGLLASAVIVRADPARMGRFETTGNGQASPLRPSLLGWRPVLPTATTLTAFVLIVILVVSLSGVISPEQGSTGQSITEEGSSHTFESRIPTVYARTLRNQGVAASGEILLLQVIGGEPVLARGANFTAHATVTDARIVAGDRPAGRHEAVIGADLSKRLPISVGDEVLLGGSTTTALTRVTIVGKFSSSGVDDDQLIVSLPVARHLRDMRAGVVNIIRATDIPTSPPQRGGSELGVTLDVPVSVPAEERLTVGIHLRNRAEDVRTVNETIRYRDQVATITATIQSGDSVTRRVTFDSGEAGTAAVVVDNRSKRLEVRSRNGLWLTRVPSSIPPHSSPIVRVVDAWNRPVPNATISVGDRLRTADSSGDVRLPVPGAGEFTIRLRADNRSRMTTLVAHPNATRSLNATIVVTPRVPSPLDPATAEVTVRNPWNRTLTRSVSVLNSDRFERSVSVPRGSAVTWTIDLPRQASGTHELEVRSGVSGRLANTTYSVVGDDRVFAAIASSGQTVGGGFTGGFRTAFGNLQVLLVTLFGLAAVMTVGGTTTAFAQAVHTRTRTLGIYRATGRSRIAILSLIVSDAIRIGILASALGILAGVALLQVMKTAGFLSLYGVQLSVTSSWHSVVAIFLGGIILAVIGAGLATLALIRGSPTSMLRSSERANTGDD